MSHITPVQPLTFESGMDGIMNTKYNSKCLDLPSFPLLGFVLQLDPNSWLEMTKEVGRDKKNPMKINVTSFTQWWVCDHLPTSKWWPLLITVAPPYGSHWCNFIGYLQLICKYTRYQTDVELNYQKKIIYITILVTSEQSVFMFNLATTSHPWM